MKAKGKNTGNTGWSVEHGVMIRRGGHIWRSLWLSGPGISWMTVFLMTPLLVIVWMSFMTTTADGGFSDNFTMGNYARIGGMSPLGYDPSHLELLTRSIFVSFVTAATCLLAALPMAFFITALPRRLKTLALILVIIPMWSNVLFRTYAWQLLLDADSWFIRPMQMMGLVDVNENIYPSWKAMMIGMLCTYLPFMAVPLYMSVEKIDWKRAEVARDLGGLSGHGLRRDDSAADSIGPDSWIDLCISAGDGAIRRS